jgi:hypothetical protein
MDTGIANKLSGTRALLDILPSDMRNVIGGRTQIIDETMNVPITLQEIKHYL